jgi:nitroimidazol reductase NimA-like FMN-containing flavoprotein (pyridoxamine 5'-phosphate oxidase superfamily)
MWIRSLNTSECTEVLSLQRFAHLACAMNAQPYVVPIYCVYADKALYAFSMPGRKIECMRANPLVSVLVEQHLQGREWRSVVAEGRYEELPDRIGYKRQRDHAWSLLSKHANWWDPGALKPLAPEPSDATRAVFFRILIEQMSGREARE